MSNTGTRIGIGLRFSATYVTIKATCVITNNSYGKDKARVTINKITYYTSIQNETDVLQNGAVPLYALYYTIEYDYEDLDPDDRFGSSFSVNCLYYDHNGNIKHNSMIQFDGQHNGKVTGYEYDYWLPLDTYKVEFSDYY